MEDRLLGSVDVEESVKEVSKYFQLFSILLLARVVFAYRGRWFCLHLINLLEG